MPTKPRKICKSNRCNNLAEIGKAYCLKHQRWQERKTRQRNAENVMFNELTNTRKWQHARLSWLRDNPLCVVCLGHGSYMQATEVDHIEPHKGDSVLFWDTTNWQSLCKSCHSIKTIKERKG